MQHQLPYGADYSVCSADWCCGSRTCLLSYSMTEAVKTGTQQQIKSENCAQTVNLVNGEQVWVDYFYDIKTDLLFTM